RVVARPLVILIEQDHEQRRCVRRSVVRRVGLHPGGGQFTKAQLVQDLAWLLIVKIVVAARLPCTEYTQRVRGECRQVGQRLEARDEAVAPEQGHEPRQSRRRQGRRRVEIRLKAKRREVGQARAVGLLQPRVL